MYKVTHGNKTVYFCKKEDAENYKDFLENGLKIVRKSCGGWLFNDGAVLFDVTMIGDTDKKYSLKKGNKTYNALKYQKKYIQVLENYLQ